MKTLNPQVLIVTAIIVIFSFLLSSTWLFIAYIANDWISPPTDERSVPAAKTY